jgi:hypothetical protein
VANYVNLYSRHTDKTLNLDYLRGVTDALDEYLGNVKLNLMDRLRTMTGPGAALKAQLEANTSRILDNFRADGASLFATLQVQLVHDL